VTDDARATKVADQLQVWATLYIPDTCSEALVFVDYFLHLFSAFIFADCLILSPVSSRSAFQLHTSYTITINLTHIRHESPLDPSCADRADHLWLDRGRFDCLWFVHHSPPSQRSRRSSAQLAQSSSDASNYASNSASNNK
jgi:hypothetical protein